MINCCMCPTDSESFSSVDDLEAHVAAEHFDCVPFECERCRFSKYPTEFAIKRHFEQDHGMTEYYIRYKMSPLINEKFTKIRECVEQSCAASGHSAPSLLSASNVLRGGAPPQSITMNRAETSQGFIEHGKTNGSMMENSNGVKFENGFSNNGGFVSGGNGSQFANSPANSAFSASEDSRVDNTSSVLAAFIRGSGSATTANALEDSNNNKSVNNNSNGGVIDENFNNFVSTILTPSTVNNEHGGGATTAGTNNFFDDGDVSDAQSLLNRLSSHISSQSGFVPSSSVTGGTTRKKKRLRLDGSHFNNSAASTSCNAPSLAIDGSTAANTPRINEVQCLECKEWVTNRATSLNYHVNMKHLRFELFTCKQCNKKFLWQRTTIVSHVQRYHNGDESLIEDRSAIYMSEINSRRKAYFPYKNPMTVVDELAQNPIVSDGDTGVITQFETAGGDDSSMLATGDGNRLTLDLSRLNSGSYASSSLAEQITIVGKADASLVPQYNMRLKCSACKKMITANKPWILLNHVNNEHTKYPLFKCRLCEHVFTSYLRTYAVLHMRKHHNGQAEYLVDDRKVYQRDMEEKCVELFKYRPSIDLAKY